MAFTGTPVIIRVSARVAKIVGISLASGATGTISLAEGAGEIKLPDSLNWGPYAGQDAGDGIVQLAEACEVGMHYVGDVGAAPGPSLRVAHTKSGVGPVAFLITFESFDGAASVSADMEIYIRFH